MMDELVSKYDFSVHVSTNAYQTKNRNSFWGMITIGHYNKTRGRLEFTYEKHQLRVHDLSYEGLGPLSAFSVNAILLYVLLFTIRNHDIQSNVIHFISDPYKEPETACMRCLYTTLGFEPAIPVTNWADVRGDCVLALEQFIAGKTPCFCQKRKHNDADMVGDIDEIYKQVRSIIEVLLK